MRNPFLQRNKEILTYALAMGTALVVLRFLEIRFFVFSYPMEIFVGGLALLFLSIGIWLAPKFTKPKTIIVEKNIAVEVDVAPDETRPETFGISAREFDVLQLMAKGHSNNEIASQLFVSPNTVKTHVSKIFEKLEVSRRTQAVEKAKQLRLLR